MREADLYQDMILDHNRNPRNFREIKDSRMQEGYNPLCGDHIFIYVKLEGDKISDISFTGEGCAICKASTSMMTEAVKGKKVTEAKKIFEDFHGLLMKKDDSDDNSLGKLKTFSGVWQYPARVKCASLPWHTLNSFFEDKHEVIKTE